MKTLALAKSWKGLFDKAAECLVDDMDRMLTFFDYPAEHHKHLQTTNPVESVFASVRLRTNSMKRWRSPRSAVHLIFQLVKRAEQNWQRISHAEKLRAVELPGYKAMLDAYIETEMKGVKDTLNCNSQDFICH